MVSCSLLIAKGEDAMKRPQYHFTPEKGWMNDPNGMVYIDGEYHLFYQFYPDDIVWGPMHWGHAVSKDLLCWEHKETALYPDELGYIFSGSCIYDKENVSGLGSVDQPPLIAFFTHHDPENGRQQQSIAYSLDKEHFVKYEENPIIPNVDKKDFRDPKVFENPINGGYTMAVAAGPDVEFYQSMNLLDWKYTGRFTPGVHGYSGICECPDCFPMETEDGIKWVLLVSMCLMEDDVNKAMNEGKPASAHMMQYYIGEFDGETFVDMICVDAPLMFEYGLDNYAAVTFANCPKRIMLGWGENWNYVNKISAGDYRGKMTLAKELSLVNTEYGYRLCCKPIGMERIERNYVATDGDVIKVDADSFTVRMEYKIEFELTFVHSEEKQFIIRGTEKEIVVDRSACGVYGVTRDEEIEKYNYDTLVALRFMKNSAHLDIVYDNGYFEIFAEDGVAVFSVMTY